MNPTESRWLHTALFIIVLLTAGGLRFTALDSAPPGLTHDEADHGLDAAGVLAGVRPIYFTVGYGREPLYDYSTAAAMLVVGENFYAGRITAGLYGMSLLVLTYLLVRHWSGDKWLALAAVGAMAISFWTVSTSRQALRSITLPVTYTLAALLMLAGWRLSADTDPPTYERAGWGWFVLAGLALGAMAYTYLAARIMWGVFPALFIALAVTRRGSVGKLWPGLALMLGVGAVTAAPLAVYLLNNPAAEARVGQLSGPLDAFLAGDPAPLLVNIRAGFGMVTFSGDDLWLYNIPGRPLLPPVLSLFFAFGLLAALVRIFTPYAKANTLPEEHLRRGGLALFAVGTTAAGLIPALITGVGASNVRVIGMQPGLYILIGMGVSALARWAGQHSGFAAQRAVSTIFALILSVTAITEAQAYFGTWANARDVRVAYHTTLVETLAYLDAHPQIGPDVALSTITPGQFHDPAVAAMVLRRDDLTLRWFDGRSALVLPAAPQADLIYPEIAEPPALLDPPHVQAERLFVLRPDDFNRRVRLATITPEPPAEAALARFGEALSLLRADYMLEGDTLTVLTTWRVDAELNAELVLFTHAMAGEGPPVAQEDSLGYPTSSWVVGDTFVQMHRLTLPSDAGPITLMVGAYTRPDLTRLPVAAGGQPAGDAFPIGTLP